MDQGGNSKWIYVQLFLGMAFFGSATPVSKIVTEHFPVFIAGGLRVLMAFLILLPFIKWEKALQAPPRDKWLLLGISAIGVVGFTAFLLFGMKRVSGVAGSIVMSATPALTATLSYLVFRDHFGWRKGLAIALAVAGVLALQLGSSGQGEDSSLWGILLVVGAILCEAGYTLMGKAATDQLSPVVVAGVSAGLAVLLFLPLALWQYDPQVFDGVPSAAWWALGWYGVGTMGVGSVLWYRGVQQVEGSTAAGFMGVMPLSALLLSYLLLGESFAWVHLLGFGLVFAGVLLIIQAHRRMSD